jgi:drug/metabolite transporter (DMT)-like permease
MAAGLALAFTAAVANAVAIVLQASEARRAPRSQSVRFSLLFGLARRRWWLVGTALLIIAWPLQVLALSFAPITVVQPMLCSFQIVLLALAWLKLGERIGRAEVIAALAIAVGLGLVVSVAPRHTVVQPSAIRLAIPLAVVGIASLLGFLTSRVRPASGLPLVIGAGLGYAWVDFANKLLSNELSSQRWGLALLFIAGALGFGAVAFLQENSALQTRPVVTVAPVIGAIQDPLPVLMALAAGVEAWSATPATVAVLLGGVALATAGAVALGRSQSVSRISGSGAGSRRRLRPRRRSDPSPVR